MNTIENETAQPNINFKMSRLRYPSDPLLKELFSTLDENSKENELKRKIKEIVEIYRCSVERNEENVEAKNLVLYFFTRFSSKKGIKRYLQDVVAKSNLITPIIKSTTDDIFQNLNKKSCNIAQCNDLSNFVSIMQNSASFEYDDAIRCLFPVYYLIFEGFARHARLNFESVLLLYCEDLFTLMNAITKQILTVFVKNTKYIEEVSQQYSAKLALSSHAIIVNGRITFDLKTKCGLIFSHSLNSIPEKYSKNFKYKEFPVLEILKNYNKEQYFTLLNNKLPVLKETADEVIIYSSVLSVLPQEKLLQVKIENKSLICLLYEGLMDCAKRKTCLPLLIVEISRTLSMMGKYLIGIPVDLLRPLFSEGISYVLSHIEHFVDTVRNYARLFFVDIVVVAAYHKNKGNNELTNILLGHVKSLSPTQNLRFLAMEKIAVHMSCEYFLRNFENVQEDLLNLLQETTVCEIACKTYIAVMEKHFQEIDKGQWTSIWLTPVVNILKNSTNCVTFCQKIITSAFQLHPPILRMIFPSDYVGNSHESSVLLKCLQNARQRGIELSVDQTEDSNLYWRGLIDKEKLEKFMIHQDEEIRLAALASIVESQKTTEMFLDWEFHFLMTYTQYNITSQIPNVIKQILSYYKKALSRYSASFNVILRNIAALRKRQDFIEDENEETISLLLVHEELRDSYKIFIETFTKLLISYLTFDANHSRRSTSLDLLITIQGLVSEEVWLNCWTEDDVKNCHNNLFDSYEMNKKMTVVLLKTLPYKYMGFTSVDFTFKYMQRSLNMATDIKPSKTLSAAYLLEVCAYSPHFLEIVQSGNNQSELRSSHNPVLNMVAFLIGKLIAQSSDKVDIANTKTAYYGIILSIRHLLVSRRIDRDNEAYSGLFDHLAKICLNLKENIMPIVSNPSPEGYLPETDEEICETDESAKAQAVLVYAWRTMKEIALLLAEIVKQTIELEDTYEMLSEKYLIMIGQFYVHCLLESKHRGVFEQAYVGFSTVCQSFLKSSNPNIKILPNIWLKKALLYCSGVSACGKMCATRRSAGLPYLILSILSVEQSFDRPYFNEGMTFFLRFCNKCDPTKDIQRIHCMNVLRVIFRHSKLGEAVSPYIEPGVIVAITGFESNTWGVRNSATLLYSTLMTRMFGVQRTQDSEDLCMKNRLTVKVFLLRYPKLFQFLLDTLERECKKDNSLTLHPVLMIFDRLYPSHVGENIAQVERYLSHVRACLSNTVYKTRELAARASVPLMQAADKVPVCLQACFDRMRDSDMGNNECHGLLLQVYHILKSNLDLKNVPLTDYIQSSLHILDQVGKKFSHLTATLYMEVIALFLMKINSYDDLDTLKQILTTVSRKTPSETIPYTAMSKYSQASMLLGFYIIVNKLEESDVTYQTITSQILIYLYSQNIEMKHFCYNLLIYMHQVQNGSNPEHALYRTGEMEIPLPIKTLVDGFEGNSVKNILTNIHPYLKLFLTTEIKFVYQNRRNENEVLLFLLVYYYPCVIKYLNLSKQETLNMLIHFCDCDNEELISAVVSCINVFLLQIDYNVLKYDQLIQVLVKSASPAASEYRRLAVCEILVKNYILYCSDYPAIVGEDLQTILSVILVLLEDNELMVRNAMSEFSTLPKIRLILNKGCKQKISEHKWPVIPEKAKEDLLNLSTVIFRKDMAICFVFSWACRHFPDSTTDASEIFEHTSMNTYAENVPFVYICTELLHKLLWPLEDGLSYEDKSIFIEEHTLIVTTVLLDSLVKNPSPMMLSKTKVSVICALKSTIKFLERFQISNNFVNEFSVYLNNTILEYLTKQVEHNDLFNVKRVFKRLYQPVFNYSSVSS